jgi:membrane associated rhomboid family serine protease
MSLQYQNEPETVAAEQEESFQRAEIVTPFYSLILIACLVMVSLCQFAVDGTDAIVFGGEKSVWLAGFDKPAFAGGEYWRILTGAVLHGGLIHLLFNCYALFVLGKLIEILSNRAHLAIIFLLAAIGGNVMSFVFMPSLIPSIGASGGILGFLGYLAAYGFLRRKLLPPSFLKNMLFNIGFIALYGLFLNQSIDNFAHLGGLIVGAVYGLIQIPKSLYADPREVGETTKICGVVALGIVIIVCLFSALKIFQII